MTAGQLPEAFVEWISAAAGGEIVTAQRHLNGASRQAWSVDVSAEGARQELFVLADNLGGSGGSARDAAVLRALEPTAVPVPRVIAENAELGAIALERVEGRSDFPAVDDEAEREPTARDLMEITATLHSLDPATLAIEHLGPADDAHHHATRQMAHVEAVAAAVGDGLAPLFAFAVSWLARNIPADSGRTALVHSDMGPGNFLYRSGKVTAVVDWEVAHWGDAMEDLAAVSVRDMATPVGALTTRFAEYAAAGAVPVDLPRVQWYRVLVLTRNAMAIGLGLARDSAALDRVQLTMYRTLLMRADALALCDAIGVDRPEEPPLVPGTDPSNEADLVLLAHAGRDQRDVVVPELEDPFAAQRARGVSAVLGYAEHGLRYSDDYHSRESDDLATVLGHRPDDEAAGYRELQPALTDPGRESEVAAFFARHLLRRGMLQAPLLGPLAERLPQP